MKLLESKGTSVIERLRNEGADSPADVLILADAARLDRASDLDLFKPAVPALLSNPSQHTCAIPISAGLVSPGDCVCR